MQSARVLPSLRGLWARRLVAFLTTTRIAVSLLQPFASNVDRVQQIINAAYKYGRKVIVEGRSMVNIITIASELGYINIPDNTLIDIDTDEELSR